MPCPLVLDVPDLMKPTREAVAWVTLWLEKIPSQYGPNLQRHYNHLVSCKSCRRCFASASHAVVFWYLQAESWRNTESTEAWETLPDWEKEATRPVVLYPMAPREARRILAVAGELLSLGYSPDRLVSALREVQT